MQSIYRIFFLLILSGGAALADMDQDFSLCEKPRVDPAGALAGCTRLLESGALPNPTAAYAYRGMAKLFLNRPQEAIEDFDTAIDRNPNLATTYLFRALALTETGDLGKALVDYNQALILQPDNADILSRRGRIKMKMDDVAAALDDFNRALAIDPKNVTAQFNVGLAYTTQGKLEQALAAFAAVERLDPDYAPLFGPRYRVYLLLDQAGNALKDLNRAIALNPKDVEALATRAWLLATDSDDSLRNGGQAIKDAQAVIAVYDNPDIRDTLAAAYAETGDFTKAIAEAGRARDMLMAAGMGDQIVDLEARIALYKEGKPYRD